MVNGRRMVLGYPAVRFVGEFGAWVGRGVKNEVDVQAGKLERYLFIY
jgi:hypothetical protein